LKRISTPGIRQVSLESFSKISKIGATLGWNKKPDIQD
jgi:hypothetical protein